MRALSLLVALCVAALANADRLILIPTGTKLPFGTARLEHLFDTRNTARSQEYFGFGVGKSFDAAVTSERVPGGSEGSFDFAFNYLDPVVNYAPGISVGVVDAMDNTADGRRFFMAVTFRNGLDGRHNARTPAETTLGGFVGSRNAMFVGISLPFSESLRLIGEHDANRITAGVEVRPSDVVSVRWLQRHGQNLWSLALRGRL